MSEMPRVYHVRRPASPRLEEVFQIEVSKTLRQLLATGGIYQNKTINTDWVFDVGEWKKEVLLSELKVRPIKLVSLGEGDFDSRGPIGIPPVAHGWQQREEPNSEEIPIPLYIPNIEAHCLKCNDHSTFLSRSQSSTAVVQPTIGEVIEQFFLLHFACSKCRKQIIVYFVRRAGLKMQIVGRSIPRRLKVSGKWSDVIRTIITDAMNAASENDIPAAYYHLRTAIEFYMKDAAKLPVGEKIEGNVLCQKYLETLDSQFKTFAVSLGPVYSTLSSGLHSRIVNLEEFEKALQSFNDHDQTKVIYMRNPRPSESQL